MNKGEIFKLKKDCRGKYRRDSYKHAFIYWGLDDSGKTIGIMLTTSENWGNKLLKKEHFKKGFSFGFGKSKYYPNSYIAPYKLIKEIEFNDFVKRGELTDKGIEFIRGLECHLGRKQWSTVLSEIKCK